MRIASPTVLEPGSQKRFGQGTQPSSLLRKSSLDAPLVAQVDSTGVELPKTPVQPLRPDFPMRRGVFLRHGSRMTGASSAMRSLVVLALIQTANAAPSDFVAAGQQLTGLAMGLMSVFGSKSLAGMVMLGLIMQTRQVMGLNSLWCSTNQCNDARCVEQMTSNANLQVELANVGTALCPQDQSVLVDNTTTPATWGFTRDWWNETACHQLRNAYVESTDAARNQTATSWQTLAQNSGDLNAETCFGINQWLQIANNYCGIVNDGSVSNDDIDSDDPPKIKRTYLDEGFGPLYLLLYTAVPLIVHLYNDGRDLARYYAGLALADDLSSSGVSELTCTQRVIASGFPRKDSLLKQLHCYIGSNNDQSMAEEALIQSLFNKKEDHSYQRNMEQTAFFAVLAGVAIGMSESGYYEQLSVKDILLTRALLTTFYSFATFIDHCSCNALFGPFVNLYQGLTNNEAYPTKPDTSKPKIMDLLTTAKGKKGVIDKLAGDEPFSMLKNRLNQHLLKTMLPPAMMVLIMLAVSRFSDVEGDDVVSGYCNILVPLIPDLIKVALFLTNQTTKTHRRYILDLEENANNTNLTEDDALNRNEDLGRQYSEMVRGGNPA